ncbi:MAG: DNA photolyase family protein [Rhodocyclaceae bacterium]|nr:DNA photolyase family protein [Rhodocyclaceae bacterium]
MKRFGDKVALVWFRRDLRIDDNAPLGRALATAQRVHCVFVFDTEILDALDSRADRRVTFIWDSVRELRETLQGQGGDLIVLHGRAHEEVPRLAASLGAGEVVAAEDYEPAAAARDAAVADSLRAHGIGFTAVKDTVVFVKSELLTRAGRPFTVFTPYRNAWRKLVSAAELAPRLSRQHLRHLAPPSMEMRLPGLRELGFERADLAVAGIRPGEQGARDTLDDFLNRIDAYHQQRDYPALEATSGLAIHNRFGTISIRRLARLVLERRTAGADLWLAELIWRDFFFQVLHHHPQAAQEAFRPAFAHIAWPNDAALFQTWREGRTGYPIVDAAMRQINATGNMHNRLRMIAASFLVKDLLVDWRLGEQYFADRLNDFDLAANNGNWQWAASTGCDAQPYFRIFNPLTQSKKFDAEGTFIRRYVPELAAVPVKFIHAPWAMPPGEQAACGCVIGRDYPAPVVDHVVQRERALALYRKASP